MLQNHLIKSRFYSDPGLYPLHLAVRKGGERCLRVLAEAGAKINMPEQKSGCTALHLAVKENLFKVAHTLITEVQKNVIYNLQQIWVILDQIALIMNNMHI